MFFRIHKENVIGYKEITSADLGSNATSHQTHIGLFDDVLTFLPNHIDLDDAFLIYNESYEELPVSFDRIQNPNGTFRSPKIKTGSRRGEGVVYRIRRIAAEYPRNLRWFLFWFGLESERPVFFIFNNGSNTYQDIINLGLELPRGIKNRITADSPIFNRLLNYISNIVNRNTESLVEELEDLIQIDPVAVAQRYRRFDIELAMVTIGEIGKAGEKLIYNYLLEQKESGEILDFVWENEVREKGLPYDFYYKTNDGRIVYLDVKTTNHRFSQKMIFSSQEAEFVSDAINYRIFRVYGDTEGNHFLKICSNARHLFNRISTATNGYKNSIVELATVEGIKLSVQPSHHDLEFGEEIRLRQNVC